jgi:hypothetical protein
MLGLSPRRKFRPNLASDPGEEMTRNPKESGAVAFRLTHSKNPEDSLLSPKSGVQTPDISRDIP